MSIGQGRECMMCVCVRVLSRCGHVQVEKRLLALSPQYANEQQEGQAGVVPLNSKVSVPSSIPSAPPSPLLKEPSLPSKPYILLN